MQKYITLAGLLWPKNEDKPEQNRNQKQKKWQKAKIEEEASCKERINRTLWQKREDGVRDHTGLKLGNQDNESLVDDTDKNQKKQERPSDRRQ